MSAGPTTVAASEAVELAVALVAVPALAGALAGLALRPGRRRRLASLLLALAPGLVLLAPWLPLSPWDLLSLGLTFGLSTRLVSHAGPGTAGRLGLGFAATLAVLVPAELAARRLLTLPAPPPLADTHLLLTTATEDNIHCQHLGARVTLAQRTEDAPPGVARVLHLGDSMVAGYGVPPDARVTNRLDLLLPGTAHYNAGIVGSGPDLQWLVMPRLLERIRPAAVVLHAFSGNDLGDVGRAYPCCPGGPLLVEREGRLEPRCERWGWRFDLDDAVVESRPPFPLLVATHASDLAAAACVALRAGQQALGGDLLRRRPPAPDPAKWRRVVRQIHEDLRAVGVPLVLAVLPPREALERLRALPFDEAGLAAQEEHRTIVREGRALGLTVLDAWGPFAAELESGHADGPFLDDPPGDAHLSAAGHELYARWLVPALEAVVPSPARADLPR